MRISERSSNVCSSDLKTKVLNALRQLGIATVDEPARQILAEQRSIGGAGVPDRNPALFTELLLSRALYAHRRPSDSEGPLLFDRGLPDVIGTAMLFGAPAEAATDAERRYPHNRPAITHRNDDAEGQGFDRMGELRFGPL